MEYSITRQKCGDHNFSDVAVLLSVFHKLQNILKDLLFQRYDKIKYNG